MVKKDTPKSAVKRGLRIGKLAATLSGSYLGYQFQNLFREKDQDGQRKLDFQKRASRQVRRELQELKGPVMKLGQMLSNQEAMIPKDVLDELAGLQMHAPAMHPTLARAQFKTSCGKPPEEVFDEFSTTPFAAASLGQVHRAVTRKGRTVAVKIQYPAIKTAITNDFKLLRAATVGGGIRSYLTKSMLDELESVIVSETDYQREAANLSMFRKALKPLGYVRVPKPLPKYSTGRVLTMSMLDGEHLEDWLERNPSRELRDRLGARLFELFYYQIHVVGVLHADPHPGNYLFSGDGDIGLVDFGCVKEIPPEIAEVLNTIALSGPTLGDQTADRLVDLLWQGEAPDEAGERRKNIENSFEFSKLVIPPKGSPAAKVDFGDLSIFQELTKLSKSIIESKQTQAQFLFVCRAEMGLYNLLHRLQAKVDTRAVIDRVLSL